MQEQSRSKVKYAIVSNKQAIKRSEPKSILSQNPNILRIRQERDKLEIDRLLTRLCEQYNELLPFVKELKLYVKDITEETHICAIYLLLCHVFDNWNSCFILAENGRSSAVGNLIRMIKEGIMQVELLSLDSLIGDRTNLEKWFSGGIIQHGTGRKKVSGYFDQYLPQGKISMLDLSTEIYQVESQVAHNAYASVLELVSPFTEDYDFDGYSGYHRTIAWLRYAAGSLEATNIAMKQVYGMVVKDKETYNEVDEILVKYSPDIGG